LAAWAKADSRARTAVVIKREGLIGVTSAYSLGRFRQQQNVR
jgi:hypothetical protein